MKYYCEVDTVDVLQQGYLKDAYDKYPVLFILTDEDIRELKMLFTAAGIKGLSVEAHILPFGGVLGQKHFKISELLEKIKTLPEISEIEYATYQNVLAWKPYDDLKVLLKKYIEYHEALDQSDKAAEIDEILSKAFKEVENEREIHFG